MNQSAWSIFIGLTVALTPILLIQPFVVAQQVTEDNNKSPSQNDNSQNTNNTRAIINLKNHTITLIDTRTNETISVKNFTLSTGNNRTNETIGIQNISGNMGNTITNESKSTKNATENAENVNLTEKFNALSK